MPLCCNCIQTDTFWINAFFFFSSMISLSLVASQSVYTPKWSSAILKTNSLPTSCCLGKEPFRGNYRCADWCERLLIIFQLAPVSGCVCVCLFLNALTFPLLWLWFPGVSLFLASSLLFLRDSDCGWLCWPHPEAFCWKQIILSIKFRSLSVSGGCEWEWPWFAHLAVWKASFLFFFFFFGKRVLSEKLMSPERLKEGASEIVWAASGALRLGKQGAGGHSHWLLCIYGGKHFFPQKVCSEARHAEVTQGTETLGKCCLT